MDNNKKTVGREILKEPTMNPLKLLELIEKHLNGEIIMEEELKYYCLYYLKKALEEFELLKEEYSDLFTIEL